MTHLSNLLLHMLVGEKAREVFGLENGSWEYFWNKGCDGPLSNALIN